MLLIILLILDLGVPFVLALLLQRHRGHWSKSRIVTIASLPIPLLCASLAALLAGYARLVDRPDGVQMDLSITIVIGAAVLWLVGATVAALAVRPKKQPPADDMAEIFS